MPHWSPMTLLRRIRRDEQGASLVEYALLVALIAIICFAAVTFVGRSNQSGLESIGSSFEEF